MEPILSCQNVEKCYGNKGSITKALAGVSFTVDKGEYLGIMGASGSGKTTLLNCISTIDKVTSGHIYVSGKDITALRSKLLSSFRRDDLGFIFQDSNLLDTLTAFENIALALTIQRVPAHEVEKRVEVIARHLSISDTLMKYPYQLSGGQKQRVAAARAIITDPSLILADEPTGALDSRSARMLLESFEMLNSTLDATILMVTYDSFAASYCKRILFIQDGKMFTEIARGSMSRKQFFNRIIEIVSILGGEDSDVL
ncbi:MAG: ABC transporter ATP-binding protein [Raoultibacter sp.]|jgi:putative ABC transport system ATP-binding protein